MRRTCLLVDDDEDDTEIFCMALMEAEPAMDCRTASNGHGVEK